MVAMAADVARNGFNVTHDLGKYRLMSGKPQCDCHCLSCHSCKLKLVLEQLWVNGYKR